MEKIKLPAMCLLLLSLCFAQSCVTRSGISGGVDTEPVRYDDAGLKTRISTDLLKADSSKANDINVHCFRGHVFLIGEADKSFREAALDIARSASGTAHVTTHWFSAGTASTLSDANIEADIDVKLNLSEETGKDRVAADVWGGNVVLTGLMGKQVDIDRVIATVKSVSNVKSVTSYLTVSN